MKVTVKNSRDIRLPQERYFVVLQIIGSLLFEDASTGFTKQVVTVLYASLAFKIEQPQLHFIILRSLKRTTHLVPCF